MRSVDPRGQLQGIEVEPTSAAAHRRSRSRLGAQARSRVRRRIGGLAFAAVLTSTGAWLLIQSRDPVSAEPPPPNRPSSALAKPEPASVVTPVAASNVAPKVEVAGVAAPVPEPKPEPKPEPLPELHREAPSKGYGVQLGAFPNEPEALDFIRAHRAAIGARTIHLLDVEIPGKGTWYRVRLGRFKDKRRAERAKDRLDRTLRDKAIVVSYR